jgi:superfamily I DNA/RNA helicase
LIALIRRMKGHNLDDMLTRLDAWRDRETQKAIAKGEDALAEQIEDRAGAISMLANSLPEDERMIDGLVSVIASLFSQDNHRLTLCTVHKAKGLEANRVFWLNRSACPSRWARQDWQKTQENNLMYVAITRAKRELVIIEERK